MFSGTLRFNIDPLAIYTDENLWTVMEKSHLKSYVSTLTGGLDYYVEEGGQNLRYVLFYRFFYTGTDLVLIFEN